MWNLAKKINPPRPAAQPKLLNAADSDTALKQVMDRVDFYHTHTPVFAPRHTLSPYRQPPNVLLAQYDFAAGELSPRLRKKAHRIITADYRGHYTAIWAATLAAVIAAIVLYALDLTPAYLYWLLLVVSLAGPAAYRARLTHQQQRVEKQCLVRTLTSGREAALAYAATHIIGDIEGSPAWDSDMLAGRDTLLDLEAIETQIYEHAAQLADIRKGLGAIPTAASRHQQARVTASYDELLHQVVALQEYRNGLIPIEKTLEELDAITQVALVTAKLDSLRSWSATSELDTKEMNDRARDINELNGNLNAQLDYLRDLAETHGQETRHA